MPEHLEKGFRPGSTAPGAFLFDASESFAKRNAGGSGRGVGGRADESVRAMRPDLASAVYSCIDAAGREWEVVWQKKLLGVSFRSSKLTHLVKMFSALRHRLPNLDERFWTCLIPGNS